MYNRRPESICDTWYVTQLIVDTVRIDPTILPPITDGQHQIAGKDKTPFILHSAPLA